MARNKIVSTEQDGKVVDPTTQDAFELLNNIVNDEKVLCYRDKRQLAQVNKR